MVRTYILFLVRLPKITILVALAYRRVNILICIKKLQNFVFWWFYVRFGLVYNILKVAQNQNMGKCQILKMTFFGLHVIFHLCVKH